VYGKDTGTCIGENTSLLAKDPYGESKILAEKLIQNWCLKNSVICTILRLPLLAGSNPPGNLALMIKGIKLGYYCNIAGGKAQKSIVLAEDVAKIIPIVANIGGVYNLTDRYHPTFLELSELIAQQLGKSKPLNIPQWIANLMAKVGDLLSSKAPINSKKLSKITSDLTFDDSKAVAAFGWNPTPVLNGFKIR
ncbi:MAG: NAD-dependent epimerase/dehydratase family protein, partial [Rickettsiales bacterium]